MEAASEGENDRNNSGEPKKPKRQMKTPYQLQVLEKTYAAEKYPPEATRLELSKRLDLTDRQLQMWFCHRRLKDKKDSGQKTQPTPDDAGGKRASFDSQRDDEVMVDAERGSDHGSGSDSESESGDVGYEDLQEEVPMVRKDYYESPSQLMVRRVIACVEEQLGERVREDGPILGMEFEELPPGAFGAPIDQPEQAEDLLYRNESLEQRDYMPMRMKAAMRNSNERVRDKALVLSDAYGQHIPSDLHNKYAGDANASMLMRGNGQWSGGYGVEAQVPHRSFSSQRGMHGDLSSPSGANSYDERDALVKAEYPDPSYSGLGLEKKRKFDEIRDLKQYENQDKRTRKELDREDIMRRKREEQMKREMEKQERERRKDEERMNRERQRLQEKIQREERRENERREKQLQKESLKAERRNKIEELRREREEARQRAALERASARKIAKESMELIDDERLELMELAASSKKLSSIVSLDYDTLQNLDSFRGFLCSFPPKSVQLKKPFTTQPWANSDENIGDLLMVWKFCISVIDILDILPFTLDEFVQALHDYDSRILREIHISLLKIIVGDIEDVARTPSGVLGTNQYTNANPEGGHPRIVEGAYLWGFDICTWKNHLNPLTWPEILRQVALSAGFGPQLKKKSMPQSHTPDNDEVKGSADVISTLRNGSAAVNAAAAMQEKGISLQRKTRHRLTPGTVKFAAYHVLSLEGDAGLNVLDLAHKIQKSGLRDLSSSKTPEASISVALSRDVILFERTAPSTYRVRPPFQKDPADAETLLATAREKIQRFENGFLGADNAEDVERDEELEGEGAESPEADDFDTPNAKDYSGACHEVIASSGKQKENILGNSAIFLKKEVYAADSPDDVFVDDAGRDNCTSKTNEVDTEVDESIDGEAWVQGLTGGEYSDLPVEERLQALVALVGIANEGNCIRAVLEGRLDSASNLKKQKWAEAQLVKKRIKEDAATKPYCSSVRNETEAKHYCAAVDSTRSPSAAANNNECSLNSAVKEPCDGNVSMMGHLTSSPPEKTLEENDVSVCKSSSSIQQNGYSAERSHLQLKSYISYTSEEVYVCRSLPLGQDRRRNRYWRFVVTRDRRDPCSGMIFVESPDGRWRLIDTIEAFDALMTSLDVRGVRESHLHIVLQNIEKSFKENVAMNSRGSDESLFSKVSNSNSSGYEPSSSFRIELGEDEAEKRASMARYQKLQMWIWNQCFSSSTLCAMRYGNKRCEPVLRICDFCRDSNVVEVDFCRSCYRPIGTSVDKATVSEALSTYEEMKANLEDPSIWTSTQSLEFRLLKALLTIIEVTVPSEGLQSSWMENCRKSWGMKLQASSSPDDLLEVLTELESVIRRDQLSTMFETTEELLASNSRFRLGSNSVVPMVMPRLPWIPSTNAAVALRLFELDGSISYIFNEKPEVDENKQMASYTVEQPEVSKAFKVKSSRKLAGSNGSSSHQKKKVRGGNHRGRLQKKVVSGRQDLKDDHTFTELLWQKGQTLAHGQRTIRKRRIEERAGQDTLVDHMIGNSSKSSRHLVEQWAGEDTAAMETEDKDYNNRLADVDSEEDDDEGAVGYEFGRWDNNGNSAQMNDDEDSFSSEGDEALEEDNGPNNAIGEYLHLREVSDDDDSEENGVRNDEDETDSGDSDGYED